MNLTAPTERQDAAFITLRAEDVDLGREYWVYDNPLTNGRAWHRTLPLVAAFEDEDAGRLGEAHDCCTSSMVGHYVAGEELRDYVIACQSPRCEGVWLVARRDAESADALRRRVQEPRLFA